MTDFVPLGPPPRPATGEALVQRVHERARAHATDAQRTVLDAIARGTRVVVAGVDLAIDADLTGIEVPDIGIFDDAAALPTDAGEIRDVATGAVRSLTVHAHPLTLHGVPVEVDVTLQGVPIAWTETTGEATPATTGVRTTLGTPDAAPVAGSLRLAAPQVDVVELVRQLATEQLERLGVTLAELDVTLASRGPRTIDVRAEASVRKGFLGAPVTASATASLDDALVLRADDIAISSSNMLVAGMLGAVRRRVEEAVRQPRDLGAMLPAGIRIRDVTVDVGDVVVVAAVLG